MDSDSDGISASTRNYVGEMGLIGRTRRNATVRATVPTETISLDAEAFDVLMKRVKRRPDAHAHNLLGVKKCAWYEPTYNP